MSAGRREEMIFRRSRSILLPARAPASASSAHRHHEAPGWIRHDPPEDNDTQDLLNVIITRRVKGA